MWAPLALLLGAFFFAQAAVANMQQTALPPDLFFAQIWQNCKFLPIRRNPMFLEIQREQ
jgi:hypothetical protein